MMPITALLIRPLALSKSSVTSGLALPLSISFVSVPSYYLSLSLTYSGSSLRYSEILLLAQ